MQFWPLPDWAARPGCDIGHCGADNELQAAATCNALRCVGRESVNVLPPRWYGRHGAGAEWSAPHGDLWVRRSTAAPQLDAPVLFLSAIDEVVLTAVASDPRRYWPQSTAVWPVAIARARVVVGSADSGGGPAQKRPTAGATGDGGGIVAVRNVVGEFAARRFRWAARAAEYKYPIGRVAGTRDGRRRAHRARGGACSSLYTAARTGARLQSYTIHRAFGRGAERLHNATAVASAGRPTSSMAAGDRYLGRPRLALHVDPPPLRHYVHLPPRRRLHPWTAAAGVHLGLFPSRCNGRRLRGSSCRHRRRRVRLPVRGRRVGRGCRRQRGRVRVGYYRRVGHRRRLHRRRGRRVATSCGGGSGGKGGRRRRRCCCVRHVGRSIAAGVHVGRVRCRVGHCRVGRRLGGHRAGIRPVRVSEAAAAAASESATAATAVWMAAAAAAASVAAAAAGAAPAAAAAASAVAVASAAEATAAEPPSSSNMATN